MIRNRCLTFPFPSPLLWLFNNNINQRIKGTIFFAFWSIHWYAQLLRLFTVFWLSTLILWCDMIPKTKNIKINASTSVTLVLFVWIEKSYSTDEKVIGSWNIVHYGGKCPQPFIYKILLEEEVQCVAHWVVKSRTHLL